MNCLSSVNIVGQVSIQCAIRIMPSNFLQFHIQYGCILLSKRLVHTSFILNCFLQPYSSKQKGNVYSYLLTLYLRNHFCCSIYFNSGNPEAWSLACKAESRGRHRQDLLAATKGGLAFMRDIGTKVPISLCHKEPPSRLQATSIDYKQ